MGKGLAEGFDVEQTRRQLKYYENLGQNLQRSTLSTTVAGGIWTNYRRYQELVRDASLRWRRASTDIGYVRTMRI